MTVMAEMPPVLQYDAPCEPVAALADTRETPY